MTSKQAVIEATQKRNTTVMCEKCKASAHEDYIYINNEDETVCERCYYDVTESARELANFCHEVLNNRVSKA